MFLALHFVLVLNISTALYVSMYYMSFNHT